MSHFATVLVLLLSAAVGIHAQCPDHVRHRFPWRELTCREQDQYLEAIERLKERDIYDDFVRTHRWMNEVAHGVAEFLPWHRWYIYQFETALREVADDPCITLPYWDWENDAEDEMDSILFDRDTFGQFSRDCRWRTAEDNDCLRRSMDRGFRFHHPGQVLEIISNFDQYTDDWDSDSRRNNGFREALEGSPHSSVHNFIGGDMTRMSAPDDPLFFPHHANVDRIWALWQDYWDHDELDPRDYDVPEHYEGSRLDRPMRFPDPWDLRSDWDFRLNGDDFPTPREVLSNADTIHVRYHDDQLAFALERSAGYVPNPEWFTAARDNWVHIECDRDDWRRQRERNLKLGDNLGDATHQGTVNQMEHSAPSLRGNKNSTTAVWSNVWKEEPHQGETNITSSSPSKAGVTSVASCMEMNALSLQREREIWDQLCLELPLTATFAERMAALAKEECRQLGNPFGAPRHWIDRMGMGNQLVAFECFHLPSRKDD